MGRGGRGGRGLGCSAGLPTVLPRQSDCNPEWVVTASRGEQDGSKLTSKQLKLARHLLALRRPIWRHRFIRACPRRTTRPIASLDLRALKLFGCLSKGLCSLASHLIIREIEVWRNPGQEPGLLLHRPFALKQEYCSAHKGNECHCLVVLP